MAENLKRRFSFRHLSFRKAKKQQTRPRSSVDVVDSGRELKRSASVQPSSRERLGASSVRSDNTKRFSVPAKQPIQSRSSVDSTDAGTKLKRPAPARPKSSPRDRLGASNVRGDGTKRFSVQAKQPIRPRSAIDVADSRTELKRQAPAPPTCSTKERLGASNVRSDGTKRFSVQVKKQPIRTLSIDVVDSGKELKRSASLQPSSRERSGASRSRNDDTKRLSVRDWNDVWNRPMIGEALEPFTAILRCDLTFEAGDQILILTCTSKQFDWWEGSVRGRTGIFPANFIQVLD